MSSSTPPVPSPVPAGTERALRELVRLKDVKDEIERWRSLPFSQVDVAAYRAAEAEYAESKPKAWEAARAALAAVVSSSPATPEGGDDYMKDRIKPGEDDDWLDRQLRHDR